MLSGNSSWAHSLELAYLLFPLSVAVLPNLLAIETTTDTCSVAVYCGGHVEIERTMRRPKVHAEHLVPMIQEVLTYKSLTVEALDGITVSGGPGSYTGLRIGVSTAKGLAFAHKVKLISIPSLSAMAYSSMPFMPDGSSVIVSRNSRKGEVYLACFHKNNPASWDQTVEPAAISLDAIENTLPQPLWHENTLWLAGGGSHLIRDYIPDSSTAEITILPATSVSPSATSVARLGAIAFEKGSFVDVHSYEPLYLKDFIPKLRTKSVFDRLPF